MKEKWRNFAEDHKNIMEFLKFFIISNGVTVLQMILMPVFKGIVPSCKEKIYSIK